MALEQSKSENSIQFNYAQLQAGRSATCTHSTTSLSQASHPHTQQRRIAASPRPLGPRRAAQPTPPGDTCLGVLLGRSAGMGVFQNTNPSRSTGLQGTRVHVERTPRRLNTRPRAHTHEIESASRFASPSRVPPASPQAAPAIADPPPVPQWTREINLD